MRSSAASLATFAFWCLMTATIAAMAWRWFGNALPGYASATLAMLGMAYGILIIAMNERAGPPSRGNAPAAD